MRTLKLAGAVAVLGMPGLGSAAGQDVPPKVRSACMADYARNCSLVIPGNGRVIACMRENIAKLEPECQAALREAKLIQDRAQARQ
jgi:hypothetical protein